MALPDHAPLEQIFILKQARQNLANPLAPFVAVSHLLGRIFPPLWSANGMGFTLEFLEDLCNTIPCYELSFLPEPSVVEYVRCLA